MFYFYIFSYILTLSGFLLGKSTKEEHKEIREYVKIAIYFLALISYIALGFSIIFRGLSILAYLIFILGTLLFYFSLKNKDLEDLHDIILIGSLAIIGLDYYYVLENLDDIIDANYLENLKKIDNCKVIDIVEYVKI